MKFVTGLLAAILLLAGVGASHAVVRIADDRGGRIGTYVNKYQGCVHPATPWSLTVSVPRRDLARDAWLPRRLGFRRQRPHYHGSRSNHDALFDVSDAGAALDRCARRLDASHDLPARQGVAGNV